MFRFEITNCDLKLQGKWELILAPMTKKRKAPTRLMAAVHDTAGDLFVSGAIDEKRMLEFEALTGITTSIVEQLAMRGTEDIAFEPPRFGLRRRAVKRK